MHLNKIILLTVLLTLSCGKEKTSSQADSGSIEESSGSLEIPTTDSPVASLAQNSKLKFKRQKLLEQEIMSSLSLARSQVCQELDSLSCVNEAHHLTLGGVDPYEKNIWENKNSFLETTPIVVERIMWNACQKRVALDLDEGQSKIFVQGKISDEAHMNEMVSKLYQNVLARDPSVAETSAAKVFASDLEEKGGVFEDWARLSCFSLMTSVEFLFY